MMLLFFAYKTYFHNFLRIIMNKNIIIYTSSLCGFCYRAKTLLKKKNIPFEEIDIDLDYSKRNEMIKKSGGRTSVPQIFFKDRHIGGCDDLYKLEDDNGIENFVK